MILGIGNDILSKNRFNKSLSSNFCNKFINHCFSQEEIQIADNIINPIVKNDYYAKRFSLKESFVKALGTGVGKDVSLKDITILNNKLGKPFIKITNKIDTLIKSIFNKIPNYKIEVSISDEKEYVFTICIIQSI